MSEEYRPRTNFISALPSEEYKKLVPRFLDANIPISECWRVFCRKRCNASNERTLIPCLIPKKYLHIISAVEFSFESAFRAAMVSGAWATVPFDWFFRSTGKGDFLNDSATLLPVLTLA